ncbi:3-dehydroquinate synthase [Flavobacteriaceae bacterium Ap0902]|nr:3-dehydroquinate synthase [Flavobacteriaceae bacterium Ap0902]
MEQAPIYFSDVSKLNKFIEHHKKQKFFLIVDGNTHEYCLPVLLADLEAVDDIEIIEIPVGESAKELEVAHQVWQSLLELGADRNSIVINCGGGVVTDFGGFIASTFKRGIKFINVPTSLLAMVDASVGGKTGINLAHSKNQIGTFTQPEMVVILPEFLETLPRNQLLSGLAEMLKHGLIKSFNHWFDLVNINNLESHKWVDLIKQSVCIKKEIVEQDPTEQGLRKILNAGHTLGHALESWYLDNDIAITHGEAVALGLLLESFISKEMQILPEKDFTKIWKGIHQFYDKRDLPESEQILNYLQYDKKNENGVVQFILLDKIGNASFETYVVNDKLISAAFEFYRSNYNE